MVAAAPAPVLAILTRAPSSGGKSRLRAALKVPAGPDLGEALLLDTVDATARPGVQQVVAVEPAGACAEVQALLPPGVAVIPQPDGDLGARMRSVMTALRADGARACVLIGSDLPDLPGALIDRAFTQLAAHPEALVLGPARDGGYYLIGATQVPPVFDGISWGTGAVLAQTIAAAARAGLPVCQLAPWSDIDTLEDLRRLLESYHVSGEPGRGGPAWRTRQWAEHWIR